MTSTGRSAPRTMVEVLRRRADTAPDRPAYLFLPDGETEGGRLSTAEVDRRARAIAAELQQRGMSGERVLIAYPTGLEYVTGFLGCLYAGAIAVPCDAPERSSGMARLARIASDAQPGLMLGPSAADPADGEADLRLPGAGPMLRLDVAEIPDDAAELWREPRPDPDALALLQYTSGSTQAPRGVMISHGNVLANEESIRVTCAHDADSTFVGWLPLFHDMGMIANVLQPLYLGSLSVLIPPLVFLARPARWLRAVSRYRANTSGGPNFGYDLCVARIGPDDRAGLDLSAWRVAFNGAEVVRPATMRRFVEAFGPAGFAATTFFPCYGLAEVTLIAAGTPRGRLPAVFEVDPVALRNRRLAPAVPGGPHRSLAGCGPAAHGSRIAIVDPDTGRPCSPGRLGEIWVGGPSIGQGYWGRPDESEHTFRARLAGSGDGPFLRTGDLGAFESGELVIAGRFKDLVVIRGQNYYPHDLEAEAEAAHPALRATYGAAFALDVDDEERLVIAYEVRTDELDVDAVARAVRRRISERHGIDVYAVALLKRGGIQKTTSGKVRRQACRDAFVAGRLPVYGVSWQQPAGGIKAFTGLPDPDELTQLDPDDRVGALAAAILHVAASRYERPAAALRVADPVSTLGLDSLAATELQHAVQDRYGVTLPALTLLGDVTFLELAGQVWRLRAAAAGAAAPSSVDPQTGPQPLSEMQRALWYEHEAAPPGPAYVLARTLRLAGPLDRAAFDRAFGLLVARHPALRTVFTETDGEPAQLVVGPDRIVLTVADASALSTVAVADRLAALAAEPFALLDRPLFRATLLRRDPTQHLLVLSAHHAVMDFWSFCLVVRDLLALYGEQTGGPAAGLPPLRISPVDAARAEAGSDSDDAGDRRGTYWAQRLAGLPAGLDLPTDRPRPARRRMRADAVRFSLDAALTARLRELGQARRSTLFTVLLTAYQVLLWRHTGQRDFAVATLASGRDRADRTDVVGCFINPVAIRAEFDDAAEPFGALLDRSRPRLLADLGHGDYPFSRVVSRLAPDRTPGRPVLAQTMLLLQREFGPQDEGMRAIALGVEGSLTAAGLRVDSVPVPQPWTHLDLTLNMAEIDGVLQGVAEYDTDLFDPGTVTGLVERYATLLRAVAADPDAAIGALDLLGPAERERALSLGIGPRRARPAAATVPDLVRAQAMRTPDRIAVIAPGAGSAAPVQLSYRALVDQADLLATRLRAVGAGPESRVGLVLDRVPTLPVAVLAALRAGAAYLPLDPDDPRLPHLLEDAHVRCVLTTAAYRDRLPARADLAVVELDPAGPVPAGSEPAETAAEWGPPSHPDQAAYVLYTSGSTGRPKGVVVPHRALLNRLVWMQEDLALDADDRVLHKTPLTFDVSLWELLWPLLTGAGLVLAGPGGHRDPAYLAGLVEREQVTTLHFVPSVLTPVLDEVGSRGGTLPSLRRLVCSGEPLTASQRDRHRALLPGRLYNLYGPTEAAIDVTAWPCRPDDPVSIGTPIANVDAHVLDDRFEPVADRGAGELCLGGVGLARGYLDRPGLTAAAFRPDPHGPPGGRLYRTGDRARRRPGGELDYLGRLDGQVKLGGNRVELGEIEAALRTLPGVTDAAAAVHGTGQRARLVGYLVGPEPPDQAAVRAALRERLPAVMVPSAVVRLARLPATRSGKLDRGALPAPATAPDRRPAATSATPLERELIALWEQALGRTGIGPEDDFFALGGDSILAIRLVAKARAAGLPVTVSELIRRGTVRSLATALPGTALPSTAWPAAAGPPPADAGDYVRPFELCAPATAADFPPGVVDAYPVSMAQQALLFQRMHNPRYEVYLTSLRLRGELRLDPLRAAVALLLDRHSYLRSSFDLASYDEPRQLVHARAEPPLAVTDLRDRRPADADRAIDDWLRAERTRPFDLAVGPLARFHVHRRNDGEFQLTLSSFGLDGWCAATALTELLRDYVALRDGRPAPTEPPRGGYPDFVALERQALASAEHRAFFAERLAGAEPCLLPDWSDAVDPTDPATADPQRRHEVPVGTDVAAALRGLAERLAVPVRSVLLAAHLRVVSRLTGRSTVLTGLEVTGRPEQLDGDRIVGVFNNVVPLRIDVGGGTWAELAGAAFAAETAVLPYRRYPFAQLEREHKVRRRLDTLFVFTHFHLYDQVAGLPGLELIGGAAPDQTYFPLTAHFNVDARSGAWRLLLDYDPTMLPDTAVTAIGRRYAQALAAIAADPDHSYLADDLLTGVERHRLAADGGPAPEPAGRSLAAAILAQAARTPDAVALADPGGQVSYTVLARRSARLAAVLRAAGVGPEAVVGVHGPRGADLVVALLAVLRSGAAYLPLDAALPPARIGALLRAAGAVALLTPDGTGPPDLPCPVLGWDAAGSDSPPGITARTHPTQLAYVLPTSGSTGEPKVTGVSHQAVLAYLGWCRDGYRLGASTRAVVHSPLGADLTVTALLGPLVTGGCAYLVPESAPPEALAGTLATRQATLLKITPAHLAALGQQLGGAAEPRVAVDRIVVGGEQLYRDQLTEWRLPAAVVVNEYGPTEATVGCVTYELGPDELVGDAAAEIPIGRPIPGSRVYLLDRHGQLVPPGVRAELYLGGAGLARGYLHRPGATAERFGPDPLAATPGERRYRTGDLAWWDPAGRLRFAGRVDRQVKIRGHRVEPAEVERTLLGHPAVRAAAVVPRPGPGGRLRLVGYYVTDPVDGPDPADRSSAPARLAGWLAERLPAVLVPAALVELPELPLTRHGKLDYAALPDPAVARHAGVVDAVQRLSDDAVRELLDQARADQADTGAARRP